MQEPTPGLSIHEIDQIMRLVDGAAIDYVAWQSDDLKVVVARDTHVPGLMPGQEAGTGPVGGGGSAGVVTERTAQVPSEVSRTAPSEPQAPQAAARATAPGESEVLAPMTGICYLRPDPSSPPYVEIGGTVAEGDTVALVEVMKTFAAVTATAAGSVVDVLVQDGSEVVLGQPMFIIGRG